MVQINNVTIKNTDINGFEVGIGLDLSSNHTIFRNNIRNAETGIGLGSSFSTVSENNITNSYHDGVYVGGPNNVISGNNIVNSVGIAVRLEGPGVTNTTIFGNNISNNWLGISLGDSSYSNVSGNNITKNFYGIMFVQSLNKTPSNNRIYGNNIICNTHQVKSDGLSPPNTWDDGYPSGGNYWSDYTGVDLYSGPYQNETRSDGIGDVPYAIDGNNTDRYPLMGPVVPPSKPYPWAPHDLGITSVDTFKTVVGQGFVLHLSVTVFNYGNSTENSSVTVYANTSVSETREMTLTGRNSRTIVSTWNTTGFAKANYMLSVYVTPVPGETDLTDNSLSDGWVVVAMMGDITGATLGVPDGKVDIRDIATVAIAFGSDPCQPNWNPNADLTGPTTGVPDNKVDIRDIATVAKEFGKVDP